LINNFARKLKNDSSNLWSFSKFSLFLIFTLLSGDNAENLLFLINSYVKRSYEYIRGFILCSKVYSFMSLSGKIVSIMFSSSQDGMNHEIDIKNFPPYIYYAVLYIKSFKFPYPFTTPFYT